MADLFASIYKGKKEYYIKPSKEIDVIITVRNKAVLAGEVKWGKYVIEHHNWDKIAKQVESEYLRLIHSPTNEGPYKEQ